MKLNAKLIEEKRKEMGLNRTQFARIFGMSRQRYHGIIKFKPIGPAKTFAKFLKVKQKDLIVF